MFRKSDKSAGTNSNAMSEPPVADDGAPTVPNDTVPNAALGSDIVSVSSPTTIASPKPPSRRSLVLQLLRREDGATLPELVAATGWQAHSVRAVLTGLRKRGYVLEKSIRDSATCYQIVGGSDA